MVQTRYITIFGHGTTLEKLFKLPNGIKLNYTADQGCSTLIFSSSSVVQHNNFEYFFNIQQLNKHQQAIVKKRLDSGMYIFRNNVGQISEKKFPETRKSGDYVHDISISFRDAQFPYNENFGIFEITEPYQPFELENYELFQPDIFVNKPNFFNTLLVENPENTNELLPFINENDDTISSLMKYRDYFKAINIRHPILIDADPNIYGERKLKLSYILQKFREIYPNDNLNISLIMCRVLDEKARALLVPINLTEENIHFKLGTDYKNILDACYSYVLHIQLIMDSLLKSFAENPNLPISDNLLKKCIEIKTLYVSLFEKLSSKSIGGGLPIKIAELLENRELLEKGIDTLQRFSKKSIEIIETILSGEISIVNLKNLCNQMEILDKIMIGLGLTENQLFAHYGFCNIKLAAEVGDCHTVLDSFNFK